MAYLDQKKFFFVSKATGLPSDTFSVVNFQGSEGLSHIYRFEINLVSNDPEIDLDLVLNNPATLYLKPNDELPIHGVLSSFDQMAEVDGNIFYKAVLVPRLWQLTRYTVSEVYLDSTVPDIIEKVLTEAGISTVDYRLELDRKNPSHSFPYREWSYVCQYQESHFNFISRWMEREGIYYYFDQGADSETLVITDSKSIHTNVGGAASPLSLYYSPTSGLITNLQNEVVVNLVCQERPLPKKVVLQDFNHRKSPPIIEGEAEVSANGQGEVYIYGEHVKNNGEAVEYAKIRAEEIKCRKKTFHIESTSPDIRSGYLFDLDSHYRADYNIEYLVTEIQHRGSQASLFSAGLQKKLSLDEEKSYYYNSAALLPNVQFRPLRDTPKPRFYGTINAKVEASGTGQYAELDTHGRYKIKLPFDRSDSTGQKASRWIRSASPLAGPNEGMHFPLRKGAEVLLTFADGDPDRPVIASPIADTDSPNVVTDLNFTKNLIKTSGGHFFEMDDDAVNRKVHIHTPGSLWQDANNSYGEYTVFKGVRNDSDAVPSGIQDLRDKMFDYNGDFKPKGMKTFIHGKSGPSNAEKGIYGTPADFDALSNDTQKWQYLVNRGHVLIQKGDKFITHEGNIYDFGGYWNYNLGNCYVENHIAQNARLNKRRDLKAILSNDDGDGTYPDLLNEGGVDWSSISWPPEDSTMGGSWGNGNVWVEKKYGNSYDYTEGNSVEVQAGGSLDVKYGGKHVEWIYRGDGSKKSYEMRGGSTNAKEEKNWMSDGTQTYSKTVDDDYKTTEIVTHPKTGVASFSFTDWPPWFNFTAEAAGIPKVKISVGASTNNTNISISVATSIGVDISAAAKFSLDLAASLFIKISAGAGIGMEIEGKPSTLTYKATNGKFRWNGPGTKVEKEAKIKADMENFALRKMMTSMKKGDLQLVKLSLAAQKSLAGIEKSDIKLFT